MNIVFAGNCQAYSTYCVFRDHLADALGHEVDWVDAWNEHRLDDWKRLLAAADIVVVQHFTGETRVSIAALCAGKRQIGFPDVRGSFLWPYGNVPHVHNPTPPFKGGGPYDPEVGDAYLNGLIEREVGDREALDRYLDHDIVRAAHVDRVLELSLDAQRGRDRATGFAIADFIEDRFRHERLFTTQGHPTLPLFKVVAAEIYARLGADASIIEKALAQLETAPFEPWHEAPLHPQMVSHLQLSYGGPDFPYNHVQEGAFTFAERVVRYMNTDWSPDLHRGIHLAWQNDLPGALHYIGIGLVSAPRSAHGFFSLANVLKRMNRFDEAGEAAREAVRIEPSYRQFAAELEHIESLAGRHS